MRAVFGAPQVIRFDDQHIALPMAHRVAVPPGLRLALRRKFPPIHIDMTKAVIRFVLDQQHLRIRNVHNPAWLGLLVKLQKSHRQTAALAHLHGLRPWNRAEPSDRPGYGAIAPPSERNPP
jgi:hypothetical protein